MRGASPSAARVRGRRPAAQRPPMRPAAAWRRAARRTRGEHTAALRPGGVNTYTRPVSVATRRNGEATRAAQQWTRSSRLRRRAASPAVAGSSLIRPFIPYPILSTPAGTPSYSGVRLRSAQQGPSRPGRKHVERKGRKRRTRISPQPGEAVSSAVRGCGLRTRSDGQGAVGMDGEKGRKGRSPVHHSKSCSKALLPRFHSFQASVSGACGLALTPS